MNRISASFISPLIGGTPGGYGVQGWWDQQPSLYHLGEDYAIASGTNVRAVANGQVVAIKDDITAENDPDTGFGNYVIIRHELRDGDFVYTLYAHLESVAVSDSEYVTIGESVGASGETGAGGIHLHFELSYRNGFISDVPGTQFAGGYDTAEQWVTTQLQTVNPTNFIEARYASADIAIGSAIGGGFLYDTVWYSKDEFISGDLADDTIFQGFENDAVDGKGGVDTVVYNYSRSNYEIRVVGNTVVVEGPEGTDHLRDVEFLSFRDRAGPPFQLVDVRALDGYGQIFLADLAYTANAYDASMGNVWFTNANSTVAVRTSTSDWGISDVIQGASELWNAFTSRFAVNRVYAADGTEFAAFTSDAQTVVVEANTKFIDFGANGSLSIA